MQYYESFTIFSEINIKDQISTILMSSNLDYELINEIKLATNLNLLTSFRNVISHVVIAAAVISYARIEMMKYKTITDLKVFYTDTDSIFVDKELPQHSIGNDLGLMKDELNGGFIEKA